MNGLFHSFANRCYPTGFHSKNGKQRRSRFSPECVEYTTSVVSKTLGDTIRQNQQLPLYKSLSSAMRISAKIKDADDPETLSKFSFRSNFYAIFYLGCFNPVYF